MTEEQRKEKRDALRWYEDARREHLGAATNLIFGLSAAGVGFCASLLVNKEPQSLSYPANYFFAAAAVLFMLAVVFSMSIE